MSTKIKHLLNYRDLFLIFIWRDFSVKYKQAALGVLWAIIQPFSFMLLFTFIFTCAMPVKISTAPYPIFFYTGLLPWTFFASSVTYSIQSITGSFYLLRNIYFPPVLLPLTGIVTAFVDFLIGSIFFVGLVFYYKIPISPVTLWYFPLFFLLLLFTLSISLVLSAINVYYRDVGLASGFLIQIIFFATPILYSIDKISPKLKLWVFMNPLTFIIENMRRCLLEGRPVVEWQYFIMLLGLCVFLFLSYKLFRATEIKFADIV